MPKLKAYTDDSAKSGTYLLANVGGPHPITLQVTGLAEQILNKAGYEPGENIPTSVVWSMFDVGLLYTSGTINEPPEVAEGTDEIFDQLNVANKLSDSERKRLLRYLREYTGPNEQQVRNVETQLEQSEPSSETDSQVDETLVDDLERISRLHEEGKLTREEYKLLKSRLLDTVDSGDSATPSDPDSDLRTAQAYLTDRQLDDLVDSYRDILPADSYGNGDILFVEGPNDLGVIVQNWHDPPGFAHQFSFEDKGQKERLQERIIDRQFEVVQIEEDVFQSVRFNKASGYADEVSDEEIRREIECCFETMEYVYDISSPKDHFSKFDW